MTWNNLRSLAMALGLSCAIALPALADNNEGDQQKSNQRDQRDRQGQYQDQRDQKDRYQGKKSERDSRRDQQDWKRDSRQSQNHQRTQRMEFDLDGWVTVATDYDKDGRFDSMETIYLYDLEKARKQSQARTKQRSQRNQQFASESRMLRTSGEIQKLHRKSLKHSDQQKVVAVLQTDNDRKATVCLGSQDKVSQLNLSEGDYIRVKGKRARIDGKSVLMAQSVSTRDGQSIKNEMPKRRNLKRVQGEVVSHREASFQGRNATYIVAQIDSDRHGRKQVNLGPKQDLSKLNLKDGQPIKVLAREGHINDREAFIAEAVRVDDQTVDVRGNTQRSLKKDRDQQNREMHRRQHENRSSDSQNDRQANRANNASDSEQSR